MIYFARHGQTTHNLKNVFNKLDASLNDTGRAQAAEVGRKATDLDIQKIVSSPLPRAIETSSVIAKTLGLNSDGIVVEPLLTEVHAGELAGRPKDGLSTVTIPEHINGAEKRKDAHERAVRLVSKYMNNDENLLLIGHSGIYRFIRTVLDEKHMDDVHLVSAFKQGEIIRIL